MKFWQAEYEAKQFSKGHHPLTEWAKFYNKVIFEGGEYWDGLYKGNWDDENVKENPVCELDFIELDADGYVEATISRVISRVEE